MGYELSLEIVQYWLEYAPKKNAKIKTNKKQKQKECIVCMYIVSFSCEHVYVHGDLLIQVYVSVGVHMWAL